MIGVWLGFDRLRHPVYTCRLCEAWVRDDGESWKTHPHNDHRRESFDNEEWNNLLVDTYREQFPATMRPKHVHMGK